MSEVTKQDLIDMEARFDARINSLQDSLVTLQDSLVTLQDSLIESMRKMQTELLRGFEAFSAAQNIRLRKVEVDQSNLDTALSGRVSIVENRLHQIELRLGGLGSQS